MSANAKERNEYLVVRNLTDAPTSFSLELGGKEAKVGAYGEVAVHPISKWKESSDIRNLEELGIIETYTSAHRPRATPRLPANLEPKRVTDKSAAHEIAKMANHVLAMELINVVPQRAMPNPLAREDLRGIDVIYLKTRHRDVLYAALWLLEHLPNLPEWKAERIAAIKDRLVYIDGLDTLGA